MRLTIATGIYPPSIGGPATYSKLLCDILPQHGFEVIVVSFDDVRYLPKILRHLVYTCKLLFHSIKSDIIFAQDPVSVGLPAVIASKILRKKLVLKVVGDYAWEQALQRYKVTDLLDEFVTKYDEYSYQVRFLKTIEKYVAQHAKKIIVPSEYLKKIVSAWGVNQEKIEVIYNAFSPISLPQTKAELRQELQLSGLLLISIGRLVPWKGFDTLIEVLPTLITKFPQIKLLIVGSGPQEKELQHVVQDHRLERYVVFVGSLSKDTLMKYIKASDVFVLNTAYEGFSHQLLEVMSVGTPVITTDVGGNPELITHLQEGLLTRYNDKDDITKSIEMILLDEVQAKKYTDESQKRVKEFSKERMITALLNVLKTI